MSQRGRLTPLSGLKPDLSLCMLSCFPPQAAERKQLVSEGGSGAAEFGMGLGGGPGKNRSHFYVRAKGSD